MHGFAILHVAIRRIALGHALFIHLVAVARLHHGLGQRRLAVKGEFHAVVAGIVNRHMPEHRRATRAKGRLGTADGAAVGHDKVGDAQQRFSVLGNPALGEQPQAPAHIPQRQRRRGIHAENILRDTGLQGIVPRLLLRLE